MNHFFAYIDRMRYIERWALMRNSVRENIQEHSHQVAVLAHALAVIRNELFGGQVDAGQVAAAALYHDAGEILTGDMPTPIKYFNPEIREAYRKVEEVADQKLLGMLPPEYGEKGSRVLDGIRDTYLKKGEQGWELHGICASAGLGPGPDNRTDRTGTPEYYLSEKQMVDNQHGAAACMMAVSEQLRRA